MSGPLQWSRGGLVPAGSVVVSSDEPVGAFVPSMDVEDTPRTLFVEAREAKPKKKAPPAPTNIVALAKARLKEVKQELRRMKALEKECGELERLIAAAEDTKPRAVVRELKRSAG